MVPADATGTAGAAGTAGTAKSAGQVTAQTTYAQGATRRDGTISTPTGAQGGAASQQISAARVRQDLVAQRVSAVASYRATPSTGSNSVLYVWFGRWSGNTCHAKAVVAASAVGASTDGVGYFLDDSGATSSSFGVSRSLQGQELTIQSSAHAGIRAADWDCAFAKVRNLQGTEDYQGFFAVDLTTTYVPQLSISTISPIQGNYRGRWTTVKLDAANRGRVDARGTTVTASGASLKFNRKKISLGTVGDRRTKYGITFKVKLTGKKARQATFTIRSAGASSHRVRVTIAHKPRPTRLPSLSGRYFWGNDARDRAKGWNPRAVLFVNKKWAYVGIPPRGVPSCRKTTKQCKRYTYRGGRLKIAGSARVKVTSEGFTRGRIRYAPLSLPRKNTTMSLTLHHQDFRGCGVYPYCTTWTETLSMSKNRRFVLTRTSISSIGYPGTGTISSRVGPDERGRYTVLSRGRVRLLFDNGRQVTKTIAIEHDVRNKPNASGAGVVIGDVNYYRPRS